MVVQLLGSLEQVAPPNIYETYALLHYHGPLMKTPILFSLLLAPALLAAPAFWHRYTNAPAALVVTPRGYVPVKSASTSTFSAQMLMADGALCGMPSNRVTWHASAGIGMLTLGSLAVTGMPYTYGWLNASASGLSTRVYLRVSPDATWNPDADFDRDGMSDMAEITNSTMPEYPTLMSVKCKLH